MAFWKQKKSKAEPFSWQSLSGETKAIIIEKIKDEFHQILEDSNKIEASLDGLYWESIQDDDTITISHAFSVGLPVLRAMARVAAPCAKSKGKSKG